MKSLTFRLFLGNHEEGLTGDEQGYILEVYLGRYTSGGEKQGAYELRS